MSELNTVKEQVEECLQKFPQTRNSDALLMLKLYHHFYKVSEDDPISKLLEVPAPESVSRARRFIQNTERKYPPTSLDVARQRQWKEEEWIETIQEWKGKQLDLFD